MFRECYVLFLREYTSVVLHILVMVMVYALKLICKRTGNGICAFMWYSHCIRSCSVFRLFQAATGKGG